MRNNKAYWVPRAEAQVAQGEGVHQPSTSLSFKFLNITFPRKKIYFFLKNWKLKYLEFLTNRYFLQGEVGDREEVNVRSYFPWEATLFSDQV